MTSKLRMIAGVGLIAGSATAGAAAETITYQYDALGRLVSSSTSGGPNSGVNTGTSFDPAGNRSQYSVSGATALRQASAKGTALASADQTPPVDKSPT